MVLASLTLTPREPKTASAAAKSYTQKFCWQDDQVLTATRQRAGSFARGPIQKTVHDRLGHLSVASDKLQGAKLNQASTHTRTLPAAIGRL